MRGSSFKAQYRQAPLRSSTPPPPVYEPLSPVLRPIEPPIANPAGGKDKTAKHGSNGASAAVHRTPRYGGAGRAHLQLSSPLVTYDPPLHSAPLPRSSAQYSPALGSPIDTLANAAVSSLQASPAYFEPSRRPSHGPISPTSALPHAAHRAPKHAYPDGGPYTYEERPSKRARSEFFPSPQDGQHHSRPATSHIPGWSYNVEQMMDHGVRMYQDNAPSGRHQEDSQTKRLSDAQLLLDFHNAVSVSHSAQPLVSTAKRWSVPHNEVPSQHTAQAIMGGTNPYLGPPYSERRHSNYTYPVRDYSHAPVPEPISDTSPPQQLVVPAVQTHTPPEESSSTAIPYSSEDVNVDKKPKKHQGWPKGKPRGSRGSTATEKKKKRSTPKPKGAPSTVMPGPTDQLQSPQSLPADRPDAPPVEHASHFSAPERIMNGLAPQARRNSCSYTTLPIVQNLQLPLGSLRAHSVPLDNHMTITPPSDEMARPRKNKDNDVSQNTICAGCHSSDSVTSIGDGEQWISCDGCKGWFHYACAGFKSEREVREIDKFYCEACQPKFGNTTKVRKSGRAHTAVDYAGLNEGILKTSDDNPEHHYIQGFKNGEIEFLPETFARLPPECVMADFVEKMNGFKEPVVIPATLNPRPQFPRADTSASRPLSDAQPSDSNDEQYRYEWVPDDGQDKIDMVIPDGLTVRRVAELYGPNEPVPVIDVKAQEGEDKRWTMAKWADYYEQEGEKPVRNVISLEVSRSKLGRLIRRPRVVRDMDLQDQVWPEDDKSHAPPVQFYCLMSVADCYTDFHIDFGGSSVYYHIIKGKKTFFFIPPTKQNLKKYEDWCLSPKQGHEFLGNQVKECYRVDLSPGDTMLIPSGWIHAVWTPEDSLVIGGNYLTRIHYGMQIKVVEIEKNTKVAPKFRYPFFQKIMWFALIRYLEEDPLPAAVEELLVNGGQFERSVPVYCETDKFGHNSHRGSENYNRRYYPKAELEGLPDLANYIWRTVMISQGRIEGITQQTRNAVTKSIPKNHGEPMILARRFARWIAWKRGNESIPQWAHPDASLPEAPEGEKKLSAAQVKKMERESWNETLKLVRGGERHSSLRARVPDSSPTNTGENRTPAPPPVTGFLRPHREHVTTPKTSQLGPKRIACDACRKRRIRCKHKDELVESPQTAGMAHTGLVNGSPSSLPAIPSSSGIVVRRHSDADIISGPSPFPSSLYDGQANINGGPVSADLNTDALANKSGRVKACADCRKSKRRCIHDEHGNIDPVKAAETPVPRGHANKKRRISDEHDGEAMNKKIKRESFAGLVNGEVSQWNRYPLQKPRSASDTQPRNTITLSPLQPTASTPLEDATEVMPVDPQLSNGDSDTIAVATPSRPFVRETVVSSIEDSPGELMDGIFETAPIDPQLLDTEPRTPAPLLDEPHVQPNGISVSPEHTRVKVQPASATPNPPRSSRVSMTPRKTSQTPGRSNGKSMTPKTTPGGKNRCDSKGSIHVEPNSDKKPRAMSSTSTKEEDMASLALALQLQMEEHGLRRRSK